MPNRKNESLERRLHHALDQIQPDENAKDRMYLEIMRRASAAEQPVEKKRPWYLRWQTSAGACTAALVCVVVAVAALHSRMPQGGTDQLEVVPPTVTTQAQTPEAPVTTTAPESRETAAETGTTAAAVTEETAAVTVSVTAQETRTAQADTEAVMPETVPQPQCTTAAVTTAAQHTTVKPSTTISATTAATAHTAAETTAQTVQTTTAAETTTSHVPIRQNIFHYFMLEWGGEHYDTTYVEVPSKDVQYYLGYGVTNGTDVGDTYTVLIYGIVGEDPSQKLAVQYAGEDEYYVFNVQK